MGGNDPEKHFDSIFTSSLVESVNASNNLITIAKRCQDKWNFDRNFFSSEDKRFGLENIHPRKNSRPTRTIHTYARGIQARQPQEMKFPFRRAGNWIFGFRRRISDTKKGEEGKKEESGQHSRRITLQFLARLTFRCCIQWRSATYPPIVN